MAKLYRVDYAFSGVVCVEDHEDEIEALATAKEYAIDIFKGEIADDTLDIEPTEITDVDDLPEGWNANSIPYSKFNQQSGFLIGDILSAQKDRVVCIVRHAYSGDLFVLRGVNDIPEGWTKVSDWIIV